MGKPIGYFGQLLLRTYHTKCLSFIPLPKSANIERVISNVNVFDFVLSEEHMKKIDDLDMGKEGARTWNPVDAP